MSMKRSSRIIAAARLAVERNAELLDLGAGLTKIRIEITLNDQGIPKHTYLHPQFESMIVMKSLEGFTFDTT